MNDNMLRDALTTIADRAHDPGPVAARITARTRVHRQRRGLLVAAAAVAGTTAGTAVLLGRTPRVVSDPPSVSPPVSPSISPLPAPTGTRVPLLFRAAWMPTGYAETARDATLPGAPVRQARSWQRGDDVIHLFLHPRTEEELAGRTTSTIGGRRAWLTDNPGQPLQVHLDAAEGMLLGIAIDKAGDRARTAQRIAASIEPDGVSECAVSLALGWLPDRLTGTVTASLNGTRTDWSESLILESGQGRLDVSLAREVSTPKGEPATLRGVPGTVFMGGEIKDCGDAVVPPTDGPPATCRGRVASSARIELGGSRILRVTTWAEVTRDELIRIMNELVVGPEPDVSWLPR
ncbi:hypothetical protein KZ829_33595 [Actinoplanes hulinensis]|uniref:Uncharacterized protein n=1 Tax=Actinoplanes hulinensis TaxID=1144547 RepID=A0ABS7BCB2_9ACTN|nr:hypothetical protein [Actinoplanes hulinensis]MBW6438673.1 hypothetical protein [Actinoplanes hulinensis]